MQNIEASRRFLSKRATGTKTTGEIRLTITGKKSPFSRGRYQVLASVNGEEAFSATGSFLSVRDSMSKDRNVRKNVGLLRKVGEEISDNSAVYSSSLSDAQLITLIALNEGPKSIGQIADSVHIDPDRAQKIILKFMSMGDVHTVLGDHGSDGSLYTLSVGGRRFIKVISQEQRYQRTALIFEIMSSFLDGGYALRKLLRENEILCLASLRQKSKGVEELAESVPLSRKDTVRTISRLKSKGLVMQDENIGKLRISPRGDGFFHLCDEGTRGLSLQETPQAL
jgi:DNA-binding MarR family transcriptional regulator